jgi:hypothetical protein
MSRSVSAVTRAVIAKAQAKFESRRDEVAVLKTRFPDDQTALLLGVMAEALAAERKESERILRAEFIRKLNRAYDQMLWLERMIKTIVEISKESRGEQGNGEVVELPNPLASRKRA